MKKVIFTVITGVCIMAGVSSCTRVVAASRNYVTRQVETGSFNGISTSNSVDVVYTQSTGSPHVEIYAPDNEIDRITVETRNGILRVGIKGDNNHKVWGSAKREVRVSAPAVNSLEASSSGDIILKNGMTSNGNITISVSSSGDVIGDNISCTGNIDLSASSSGDIKAGNMKCRNLTAAASSSGDVKIGTLSCDNFTAHAGSSGDVVVRMLTAQNVKAHANSSGDVKLSGTCVNAELNASSSGGINASGLKAKNISKSESSSGSVVYGN
ncbi:GIN domain-containing protein [Muribaculum intestinale]|uniref:GIN domain-containing protein n=2 Tax=Muribaculum intestinale TaxID=1796646 RepID=UPI00241EE5D0|nr:DUF2807 domain-containing protein [Muribaculum intestinale]